MINELLKLGFTDEEAKVYLSVLELGGGPVSIIAKKADLHRVSCYHTLDNLVEKKILTKFDRNGIRHYVPEKVEKLQEITEEKVNIAKFLMPELKSIISSSGFKPKVRFYEGQDGVERVFEESLSAKSEILGYSNLQNVITYIPDFFKIYSRKRFEKKIKSRYLSPNTLESVDEIKEFLPINYDRNLIEILLVNKAQFLFDNEILIFNNIVGIVSLNPTERLGLIVESPSLSKTMKAVFDLAWLGATTFVAR